MLTILGFCFLTYASISSSENNEHVSTEQFVRQTPVALSPRLDRFLLLSTHQECSEAVEYEPQIFLSMNGLKLKLRLYEV